MFMEQGSISPYPLPSKTGNNGLGKRQKHLILSGCLVLAFIALCFIPLSRIAQAQTPAIIDFDHLEPITPENARRLQPLARLELGEGGRILTQISWSADSTRLVISISGDVKSYDIRHLDRAPLDFGRPDLGYLIFSPDGKSIAYGNGPIVWLQNTETAHAVALNHHDALGATVIGFSQDGSRLITRSYHPAAVKVWDVMLGTEIWFWSFEEQPNGIAFAPQGTLAAFSSYEGTWLLPVGEDSRPMQIDSFTSSPWILDFNPQGNLLVYGWADVSGGVVENGDAVMLWDVQEARNLGMLPLIEVPSTVAFNSDGSILAIGEDYGEVRLWDVARAIDLWNSAYDVDWEHWNGDSETWQQLADQEEKFLWTVLGEAHLVDLQAAEYSDRINALAFSPNNKLMVSVGTDLRLWGVAAE
jgi:WD40 repeat protein